jgi:hypothetical protein
LSIETSIPQIIQDINDKTRKEIDDANNTPIEEMERLAGIRTKVKGKLSEAHNIKNKVATFIRNHLASEGFLEKYFDELSFYDVMRNQYISFEFYKKLYSKFKEAHTFTFMEYNPYLTTEEIYRMKAFNEQMRDLV